MASPVGSTLPTSYDRFLKVVKRVNDVNGIRVPLYIKPESVEKTIKEFQLKPDDIWIATYPKAGTSWAQQIVRLIRNEGEHDGVIIDESVPWFEANGHFNIDLSSLSRPRAFKSHMPYGLMPLGEPNTTPCKYIYITRNPKDIAVSFYHHYRKAQVEKGTDCELQWDIFFEAFASGRVIFGDFFDHVLSWWAHKDDENVLFLTFEEMKRNHKGVVARIAKFIEIEISEEVISKVVEHSQFEYMKADKTVNQSKSLIHSREGEEPFMRKGEVGDWKSYFTPEQSAEMDKLCRERLEGSGLVFEFESAA